MEDAVVSKKYGTTPGRNKIRTMRAVFILNAIPTNGSLNPNRSLDPAGLFNIKVFSCPPESKECLPLIHGSHKT